MTDAFLKKVRTGEELIGIYFSLIDPTAVEMAAQSGYDFARIDLEHTLLGMSEVRELIRTANLSGLPIFIRVPSLENVTALLDMGADGIIVPGVDSAEKACAAIDAVKFAPVGQRGIAGSQRNTGYGARRLTEYIGDANRSVFLCVQIESKEGVEHIDEILSLNGIDMVSTGKHDLSQSYGIPGQNTHPTVVAAEEKVIQKSVKYGKVPILLVSSQERKQALLKKGVKGFMIGRDSQLLRSAMKENIKTYRQA